MYYQGKMAAIEATVGKISDFLEAYFWVLYPTLATSHLGLPSSKDPKLYDWE